jgi:hypothetical protein
LEISNVFSLPQISIEYQTQIGNLKPYPLSTGVYEVMPHEKNTIFDSKRDNFERDEDNDFLYVTPVPEDWGWSRTHKFIGQVYSNL